MRFSKNCFIKCTNLQTDICKMCNKYNRGRGDILKHSSWALLEKPRVMQLLKYILQNKLKKEWYQLQWPPHAGSPHLDFTDGSSTFHHKISNTCPEIMIRIRMGWVTNHTCTVINIYLLCITQYMKYQHFNSLYALTQSCLYSNIHLTQYLCNTISCWSVC